MRETVTKQQRITKVSIFNKATNSEGSLPSGGVAKHPCFSDSNALTHVSHQSGNWSCCSSSFNWSKIGPFSMAMESCRSDSMSSVRLSSKTMICMFGLSSSRPWVSISSAMSRHPWVRTPLMLSGTGCLLCEDLAVSASFASFAVAVAAAAAAAASIAILASFCAWASAAALSSSPADKTKKKQPVRVETTAKLRK